MSAIRENWRIVLLVILLIGSTVALVVPGATAGGETNETQAPPANVSENATEEGGGLTNLQYGIQLEGGSRIRAPIVGITAENVDVTRDNAQQIESNLSQRLGVDPIDVEARPELDTAEVFSENVSQSELRTALQEMGYDVSQDDVRSGVTQPTRDEMVRVIEKKLQVSALSGINVREARTPSGEYYIVVEATGRDIGELRDVLDDRGVVRLYGAYEADNGTFARQQLLTQQDISDIGNVEQRRQNQFGVDVTVRDSVVDEFLQGISATGLDDPNTARGAVNCNYNEEAPNESSGRCLLATLNGEVVYAEGISPGLVSSFQDGSFANDPTFVVITSTREQARDVELSLKAGAPLPAPLDFEEAQTTSLQSSLGEQFKTDSLITGLMAVLAVSAVVYLRYGDSRVAVPMVFTALSEVVILLGFVAAIQFPIDLSHIAGFIAVIGTGVDDLIIIADEILQEEGVATGRVFENRFRKAFWVIGAAAATTIIAMSPLMFLSLGDLTGFAIITIIGVLVGVLVTRPAYGDILRHLVLSEEER